VNITTEPSGDTLTVTRNGRLDAVTAPSLNAELALDGVLELGLSMLATKIPNEQGLAFWNHFEKHYFADKSGVERAFFEENKFFLASLRLISSVTFLPGLRSELERWIKDILLPRIMATRSVRQVRSTNHDGIGRG
jgi:hypothetical protein